MERQYLLDLLKEKFLELRSVMKGDSLIDSVVSMGMRLGLKTSEIFSVVTKEMGLAPTGAQQDYEQKNLLMQISERAQLVLQSLNIQKYLLGLKVSPVAISNARSAVSSAINHASRSGVASTYTVDDYTRAMAFSISSDVGLNNRSGVDHFNQKRKGALKRVDGAHDQEFMDGLKKLKSKKGLEQEKDQVLVCIEKPFVNTANKGICNQEDTLEKGERPDALISPQVLKQRD